MEPGGAGERTPLWDSSARSVFFGRPPLALIEGLDRVFAGQVLQGRAA